MTDFSTELRTDPLFKLEDDLSAQAVELLQLRDAYAADAKRLADVAQDYRDTRAPGASSVLAAIYAAVKMSCEASDLATLAYRYASALADDPAWQDRNKLTISIEPAPRRREVERDEQGRIVALVDVP